MAMLWPKQKVALEVVDGPSVTRVTSGHEGWTIVRATSKELEDYEASRQIMAQIGQLLKDKEEKSA